MDRGGEGGAGEAPVLVAGNKDDLRATAELTLDDIEQFARDRGHDSLMTSAKTGRNAEEAFQRLASRIAATPGRSDLPSHPSSVGKQG